MIRRAHKNGRSVKPAISTRCRFRRFLRESSGVSAVEAALLMPVFLMFIIGIIEIGRAAYTKAVITFAVQEVSRVAMVDTASNASTLKSMVEAKIVGLNPDYIEALDVSETVNADLTKTVTMTLDYKFVFLVPILEMTDIIFTADQVFIRE